MKGKAGRVSLYGMLLALAMVLSYVEALIPINIGVPGVKLGLPNIVTVFGLYSLSSPAVLAIGMLRIFLVAFFFGNTMTLAYSTCGFLLSFFSMLLLKRAGGFSETAVSVAGGVAHNIGQLAAAIFLLHSSQLVFYLPVLITAGIVSGAVIGIVSAVLLSRVKKYLPRLF